MADININELTAASGRMIGEANVVINVADLLQYFRDQGLAIPGSVAAQFGQLAIDNTAGGVALVPALYGTHKRALITVETAQIRFRIDGGAPTSTVGHILNPGDTITLDSNSDIANFKAIRTGTLSGLITATYGD